MLAAELNKKGDAHCINAASAHLQPLEVRFIFPLTFK